VHCGVQRAVCAVRRTVCRKQCAENSPPAAVCTVRCSDAPQCRLRAAFSGRRNGRQTARKSRPTASQPASQLAKGPAGRPDESQTRRWAPTTATGTAPRCVCLSPAGAALLQLAVAAQGSLQACGKGRPNASSPSEQEQDRDQERAMQAPSIVCRPNSIGSN